MARIGTMNVVGTKKSYNQTTQTDIFNISGESTSDHIWPLSRNGSNMTKNIQLLTKMSNNEKSYDLKGYINNVRFSVMNLEGLDEFGKPIGTMFVSYNNGIDWYEVV